MPPHLLTLPREVRDQILGYCLIFDGEIIPYPTRYEITDGEIDKNQPLPCTALLAVNKVVRDEAAAVLFPKNTWRISNGRRSFPAVSKLHRLFLYHATITVDCRASDSTSQLEMTKEWFGDDYKALTSARRRELIHEERNYDFIEWWVENMKLAERFSLKTLRIDFTNCYCPSGCCRAVQDITEVLPGWTDALPTSCILTAIGLISDEELEELHRVPMFRCKDCVEEEGELIKRYCCKFPG